MMNKKAVGAVELMVGLIILIVVGIGVGGSLISDRTTYDTVTAETQQTTYQDGEGKMGYNGTFELQDEPVVAGTEVITSGIGTLVRDTNYTIDNRNAVVTVITNYSGTAKYFNITYDFEPAGYTHSATARTVVLLIVVFLAIGALVMVAKDVGLGA